MEFCLSNCSHELLMVFLFSCLFVEVQFNVHLRLHSLSSCWGKSFDIVTVIRYYTISYHNVICSWLTWVILEDCAYLMSGETFGD